MTDIRQEHPELALYSVQEVAELTGCNTQSIYNAVLSGELHAVKIAEKWRVSEQDYKEYLQLRRQKTKPRKLKK